MDMDGVELVKNDKSRTLEPPNVVLTSKLQSETEENLTFLNVTLKMGCKHAIHIIDMFRHTLNLEEWSAVV